jgi:transforming growth factor-beta-induced protein
MKRYLIIFVALVVMAVPLVVAACGGGDEQAASPTPTATETPKDIVDTAVAAGDFTTLAQALTAAGLVETLKGEGPYTVFAPTDAAFAALPEGTVDTLLEDPTGQLTDILTYHVVPGKVMSTDLSDGMTAETVQGGELTFSVEDGTVMVNGATVTTADIETSNGVIHVIDSVLLPPKDIVDTAVEAGSFTILAKALTEAGLVETLKGDGPYTVFAPTDEAFAKLPQGTVDELLKDPEGALADILTYHVVPGKVMSTDLSDGMMADTVQGDQLKISIAEDGTVMVNDATVTQADIQASNGVIHVIDTVLLPPEM